TVPHHGLPGCDGSLRLVEQHLRAADARRSHRRPRGAMTVADARLHRHRIARRIAGDEVRAGCEEPVALQIGDITDADAVRTRIDVDDISRRTARQSEPLPLSDRVRRDAGMRTDDSTGLVDQRSRLEQRWIAAPQEASIVVIRNEADLLALGLFRGHQAHAARIVTDAALFHIPDREVRSGQLALAQRPQEIRLILSRVFAAPQQVAAGCLVARHTRVVSGGDSGSAPCVGAGEQRAELEIDIAGDARDWRAAAAIRLCKAIDDRSLELVFHIENVVGNAERARDPARVVYGLAATAGTKTGRGVGVAPYTHGDADDLVTTLHQ